MEPEYYSVMAPEELHYFVQSRPWDFDFYEKYGVKLASIAMSTSIINNADKKTFSKKRPLALPSGIEIHGGSFKVATTKKIRIKTRVDSVSEIRELIKDIEDYYLSKDDEVTSWLIEGLSFFSQNEEVRFHRINPNKKGVQLYLTEIVNEEGDVIDYKNADYTYQNNLCKRFGSKTVSCETVTRTIEEPACHIEMRDFRESKKK